MLMPIVSMNKMAMNESVAAACCYRQQVASSNIYWETLNGGWIGAGYVEVLDLANSMNKTWLKYPNDVSGLVNGVNQFIGDGTVRVGEKFNTDGSSAGWFVFDGFTFDGLPIATYLSNMNYSKLGSCSHSDGNCAYYDWGIVYKNNQHFESKTSHTYGGTDWKLAHDAMQFNS